jgi:hypothetical protein
MMFCSSQLAEHQKEISQRPRTTALFLAAETSLRRIGVKNGLASSAMRRGHPKTAFNAFAGLTFRDAADTKEWSHNRRDRWRCPAKFGLTLRPMGPNPVCYNYRTTLISYCSCLNPIDTFRYATGCGGPE